MAPSPSREEQMSDITPNVAQHFQISCRTCGSGEVEVYFYPGSLHEGEHDPAYLGFRCNSCGKSLDL